MIETWLEDLPHGITLSCRACGQPDRPVLLFLLGQGVDAGRFAGI